MTNIKFIDVDNIKPLPLESITIVLNKLLLKKVLEENK